MTATAWAGVFGTLAMVLGLILALARVARRFMPGATTGETKGVRVVQRIALGQKQSIAVVEVAGQRIALGVGEGGVRQLFTVQDEAAVRAPARASHESTSRRWQRCRATRSAPP
ncbi:MAG: flagellar biosynthetic protein FliO [Gemmatimonadaceae bacterium]|nr:flagellar biosynthetic protein FliO [Gemmatimonadaceae bacterium]